MLKIRPSKICNACYPPRTVIAIIEMNIPYPTSVPFPFPKKSIHIQTKKANPPRFLLEVTSNITTVFHYPSFPQP